MATKKTTKVVETEVQQVEEVKKVEACDCKNCGRTAVVGWFVLLFGGIAHMLPTQMAPVLNWSIYGVSVQMAVGAVSVVIALYYLIGD